ncbi:glycosyltransferase [Natrinema longum]|uniref:Glycosyltransferase n=1 Tax=Natrinema longum TaxID=370324 RepID=A0A8A2U9V7_9EURY|nr:glycosyltransferase [Natrinema longum]MBZ6496735.1 glycosyltransferase [Natrinema longum]QSW85373.1 glycosyltransferase [Natrinema longum]
MSTPIGFLSAVAIVFGLVWLYVNGYTFAPVYRKAFYTLIGRAKDPRVYDEGTAVADGELPVIDVLLPAYDESETIGYSIRALRAAEYPTEKLRVHVVVEASDQTTRGTLSQLKRRYDFREIVVPPSYPGTPNKPRALNYAFERTTGDIVGVIDAEDVVAPELFRQVVCALVDGDHDYVQGRLDMENEDDGLLNTLFRGEYGFWYGMIIPSYFRVGYPVPLGGTTNFATRAVLEAAAAKRLERFGSPWNDAERETLAETGSAGVVPWDPRNVTEDFELGLLLWETGYSMAMVTAVTREESPIGLNGWVRQRTRWQKGKLFTLSQRLRYPPAGIRRKVHIYTQSAMPHLGPINVVGILLVLIYARLVGFLAAPVVAVVLLIGLSMAIQQMVMHTVGYWQVTDNRGLIRIVRATITFVSVPLYWVLQWGADVRAFVQLGFGHLAWEKTSHEGRHVDTADPAAVGSVLSIGGFQVIVAETADGWTWMVNDTDDTVAQATGPFPSEADARAGAELFGESLAIAVGSGSVFEIGMSDPGWTWHLVADEERIAVAPTHQSSVEDSLESVGRVQSAAGLAVLRADPTRERQPDTSEREPERVTPVEP